MMFRVENCSYWWVISPNFLLLRVFPNLVFPHVGQCDCILSAIHEECSSICNFLVILVKTVLFLPMHPAGKGIGSPVFATARENLILNWADWSVYLTEFMQQAACASENGTDLSFLFLLKSVSRLSWAGFVKEKQWDIRAIKMQRSNGSSWLGSFT